MKIGIADRPIAIIAFCSDGPRNAASAIARIRNGAASSASVRRETAASVQPRRYPARTPSGTPVASAMATETTPASSEACAPQTMRARMSRPSSSVPSGCAVDGAWRTAPQSVAAGPGIGSTGARTATRTKNPTKAAPKSAGRFDLRRIQARLCRGGRASISVSTMAASLMTRPSAD